MKTKLTTIFKKSANTPPMWACLLFALVISTNCWADPIAIGTGTGTVTLNSGNVTPPPGGKKTHTMLCLGEECIDFTSCASVDWEVTFVAGVYDIDISYGTQTWGFNAKFSVVDPSSGADVAVLYDPAWETSGGTNTEKNLSVQLSSVEVNVTTGNTYYIRVTGGNSGLCVGHISFTREEGLDDMVTADYLQTVSYGETTLPAENSTNNTTNENISVVNQNVIVEEWGGTKYMIFDSEADYLDINIASGYRICGISTATYYDGNGEGQLNIKYSLSSIYDDSKQTGSVVRIRGGGGDNCSFGAAPETISMNKNDIPNHAKSARIYKTGTREWGIKLLRLKVSIIEDECTKKTASFVKEGTETGSAPGDIEVCEDGSFSIPGKGSLSKTGNVFAGWNDGSATYQEGDSYDMSGSNHTFTAVWNPMTVPTVTNLAVVEAIDKTVPLSWKIPGICDLSQAVNASGISEKAAQSDGYNNPSINYNSETNIVTAAGAAPHQWQYGTVFQIPTTSGIESITIDCQGTLPDGVNLWGGVIANEGVTYWHYDAYLHNYRPSTWDKRTFTLSQRYWNDGAYSTSTNIQYLGVFANAGNGNTENISFSVREARYHIAGREDIDHVIVVRKEGSAPANATDGTVYNVGTKSHFVDTDDTKEFGQTYYYSVYAVHADGTLSEATTTSHTIVETPTCNITFNVGDGAIGDAPDDIAKKPENSVVTLPSIGSAYKPFYAFTGWKKNNAGDLLAAGSTYTVTAEDITAETISFTAQWVEDNTTIRIPSVTTLDAINQSTNVGTSDIYNGVDFDGDKNNDAALALQNSYVEWNVFITPGYYDVSMLSAVERYGIAYKLSLIDPLTGSDVKVLFTQHISRSGDETVYIDDVTDKFDLTDLVKGKRYVLKIEDTWTGGCYLRVHDINFNPVTPEEIASETVLDAGNTVTTGLTEVTDVDFPGDNDESVNLYNKKMDWVVKINPGYYNISLQYGAPEYSTRVSVALIDPEGVEPTRWFCPDQNDRNGHYYYTSGSQGEAYHSVGEARYNLYDITPDKSYILRVHDENGSSNSLRVKNLTFSPIAPEVISNVTDTRLDATNTILPPTMATDLDIDDDSNVDNLMNLYNTNAEWLVTLQKGLYDVQLVYGAPSYGIKVAVKLIDPAGEESDRVLSIQGDKDYYEKSNPATTEEAKATTPHHYTSATKCTLLDVTEDKIYKVRVADVYPKCNLRVSHVLFTPIAPLQIPNNETRLDANNVFVAPAMNGDRIDISNRKEAVWYAKITPIIYDFSLNYYAEAGGTKVRFGIVDAVTGDTIFRDQQNKYDADHTTYTINSSAQDLQTALDADKVYKIFVKDNYAITGSVPQINYLEMVHHAEIHTRSGLRVGDFGTICLPYAVAAEDRNGADLFEIDKWDPNGASLTLSQLTNNENMVAGRPYIFQATEATATFRYYAEGDEAEAGSNNGLVGSYVQALIQQNNDNYIIYNNKLYLVNSEAYVGANRAYIHKQDQVQPAPAYRRRVTLSVNGAQVATDIDLINDPAQMTKYIENGHLFIFRDGKLYNAQGQLVK